MAVFLFLLCATVIVVTQFAPSPSDLPAGVSLKPLQGAVYTECAKEGGNCRFSGEASVRYGAQGKFHYLTRSNGVSCGNENFGDPIAGEAKGCAFAATK